MSVSRRVCFVALVAFATVSATGCGAFDLANAASKLANDQIGALTANDLKILSEAAVAALNSQNPNLGLKPLTQEQADALVAFFKANNIQNQQDLQNLKTQAENDPGSIKGVNELAAVFGNVDPNSIDQQQLDQVLQQAFGGGN